MRSYYFLVGKRVRNEWQYTRNDATGIFKGLFGGPASEFFRSIAR